MMKIPKPQIIKSSEAQLSGGEPASWETVLPADRKMAILKAFNFYNYTCSRKNACEFFLYWAEYVEKISKADLMIIKSASDKEFNLTSCWISRMITKGFVPDQSEIDYMASELRKVKESKKSVEPVAVAAAKPNIQDYILDKFTKDIGELEGSIDDYFEGNSTFSALDFFKKNNVSAQHVTKIPNILSSRIQELNDYVKGKDIQLNEGYSNLGKSKAKKALKFYNDIINDSMAYVIVKKSTKAKRKRKPVSIEKLVSKMKYMKSFDELKLASINPRDIIEASELWIYHTKYRKIGRYVGVMSGALTVKGSSIIGFDEKNSFSKKLRKPIDQLKQFYSSSKPQMRKFMDGIKSVESRLSPRINKDTILLKVI